jgi:hypothetical protein
VHPLGSTAAQNESQFDFGESEFRGVHRDPHGATHRRLATTAEREAIDGRDYRFAKILDEIEDFLYKTAVLLRLKTRELRKLSDVGAGNESFVASASQDNTAHRGVIPRVLKRCFEAEIVPISSRR